MNEKLRQLINKDEILETKTERNKKSERKINSLIFFSKSTVRETFLSYFFQDKFFLNHPAPPHLL